jgi:hypothetical protein
MPSAVMHKHTEPGRALNPNQGCQQREARLITARGPADLSDLATGFLSVGSV